MLNSYNNIRDVWMNQIKTSFNKENLLVFSDSEKLKIHLQSINLEKKNLLMMSSGNFNKLDLNEI
jgi:UDP-N-acetylmuramate: L-alanyl-gamma-D-glutamyl-meso-diaminopimelate ligase